MKNKILYCLIFSIFVSGCALTTLEEATFKNGVCDKYSKATHIAFVAPLKYDLFLSNDKNTSPTQFSGGSPEMAAVTMDGFASVVVEFTKIALAVITLKQMGVK